VSYKIKPGNMFLTDFKRFGLLRIISRHKCSCGEKQMSLALHIARMFGGRREYVERIEDVTRPARNRMITQEGIALKPKKAIALKYGLSADQVRRIIQAGLHRKFPLGSVGKSKARKSC